MLQTHYQTYQNGYPLKTSTLNGPTSSRRHLGSQMHKSPKFLNSNMVDTWEAIEKNHVLNKYFPTMQLCLPKRKQYLYAPSYHVVQTNT